MIFNTEIKRHRGNNNFVPLCLFVYSPIRLFEIAPTGAVHLTDDLEEILPVLVFEHGLRYFLHFLPCDPSTAVGDAFETGNLQSLALLDNLHEDGCLGKRVVGAGVEPGESPSERLHLQPANLQEALVDSRNLQLPACGGLDGLAT